MELSRDLVQAAEDYLLGYYTRETTRLWRTWGSTPPAWFDHRADLYCWKDQRNSFWIERGVYSREVIRASDRVLDLCCGDGFYDYYFYGALAGSIVAVDRDRAAIEHARYWHSLPNIEYVQADIIEDLPGNEFDVIVWDMAMEHFSAEQIQYILSTLSAQSPRTTFCGSTILTAIKGRHPEHQCEFAAPEDLAEMLKGYFREVRTFVTTYPGRDTVYFRASNGIPRDRG